MSTIGTLFLNGNEELDTIMVNSGEPVALFPWSTYFNRVDTNACVLLVPSGASDAYRGSPRWSAFSNIQEYNTTFEVSQTEFNIEAAGGKTAFFTITSNTEWRIMSNEQWLQLSDTLGMNSKTVTITADANAGPGDRQAIIDIMPLAKEPVSLYITQAGTPTNVDSYTYNNHAIAYNASQKCIVVKGLLNQMLSVFTTDGKLIITCFIKDDGEMIYIGNLPDGIYIIKALDETMKIVISD